MRRYGPASLFLALLFGAVAAHGAPADDASAGAAHMKRLVDDNTAFALDFYRQLRSSEGNVFFSPYSISTVLAVVYAGARGETEKQMANVLHFSLSQDDLHPAFGALQTRLNAIRRQGTLKLFLANSLWPQRDYRFLDAYLSLAQQHYGVSITPVDYAGAAETARRQINLWVEDRTEQKIKDFIPPRFLNSLTELVLVNAVYFRGMWTEPFEPRLTKESPFRVTPEETVSVPMMTRTGTAQYAETQMLQILSTAYRGGSVSMLVLLPRKIDGLGQLEEDDLSAESIKSWREQLHWRTVEIFLPKFKTTRQFRLNAVLQGMGMTDAFHLPPADFSGLTGARDLFVSAVVHQAFIEVDEKGAEAAAATGTKAGKKNAMSRRPQSPPVFRADHPFLFLIQDNQTGTILFLGRLTDPTRGN